MAEMNKGGKEDAMFGLKVQAKNLKTSVDSRESPLFEKTWYYQFQLTTF